MNGFNRMILAVLDVPPSIKARIAGAPEDRQSVVGAMQAALEQGHVAPWLGPTWLKLYQEARRKVTAHNWIVERGTATETRERCQGHCQAICRRDVRSGRLVSFDLNGQVPRNGSIAAERWAGSDTETPIPRPFGDGPNLW